MDTFITPTRPTRPSKRQIAKHKSKQLKDLYFLIQWCDEDQLYDVLSCKLIELPDNYEILEVPQGTRCKAKYKEDLFEAVVISSGKYVDMKRQQDSIMGKMSGDELQSPSKRTPSECIVTSPSKRKKINSPKKGRARPKVRPSKKVLPPAKKKIKPISDDRARERENSRVSCSILNSIQASTVEPDVREERDIREEPGIYKEADEPDVHGEPGIYKEADEPDVHEEPDVREEPEESVFEEPYFRVKKKKQEEPQQRNACSVQLSKILAEASASALEGDGTLSYQHQLSDSESHCSYSPSSYSPSIQNSQHSAPSESQSYIQNSQYSAPYRGYCQNSASNSYQSSPSQSPWQSPNYYMPSMPNPDLLELRTILKDGLSGMCTRINSLQTDIDKVNKKLVKYSKRGKEKEEVPRASRSDSEDARSSEGSFNSPSGSLQPSMSPLGISEGCILGDPNGPLAKRIHLSSPTQRQITAVEAVSKGPSKLALKLLSTLFTKEEIAAGICVHSKGAENVRLLDQTRIQGIKLHIDYVYPLSNSDAEKERWHTIIHVNLNNKCRNTKNSKAKV